MKIKTSKEKLINIISKSEKISGKNISLPILSNIILEAKGEFITASANNLDIGVDIKYKGKIEEEGRVAVSGQTLLSFLNNLSKNEDEVLLETESGVLRIETEKSKAKVKTYPEDDFPSIPEITTSNFSKIESKVFVDGLKSVWYAAAVSSVKPELSSIYLHSIENELVFVATDSFRLAEKRVGVGKDFNFGNILIPFRNVVEIVRILEDLDEEIFVYFEENQIGIKTNAINIVSRIIDGNFPDYKQIIPKGFGTKILILKEEFSQAIKTVNIFSDKFNQTTISVDIPQEKMFISAENQEKGNSENVIKVKGEGESVVVNFNHKYILDCFNSIDSESLSLEFNGKNKPLVIRGHRENTFMYLVMPMNR